MTITIGKINLECVQGDISSQPDIAAVVNAANAQLKTGGGVAGAIHHAAGPELAKECESKAPLSPGEAVISGAHQLPNEYVIHCLGPVYGRDTPGDQLLAHCYRNALVLAEKHKIKSIAFPAISTGAFGYPMKDAAEVAFQTIKEVAAGLKRLKIIRFVLFNKDDLQLHEEKMKRVFNA